MYCRIMTMFKDRTTMEIRKEVQIIEKGTGIDCF